MIKIVTREKFLREKYEAYFVYGAGKRTAYFDYLFSQTSLMDKVYGFVDSDINKQGTSIELSGHRYRIFSPDIFAVYKGRKIAIIISCEKFEPINEWFESDETFSNADWFVLRYFEYADNEEAALKKTIPNNLHQSETQLIPKKIHYCWFGGNPIPAQYQKWIDSWKTFCPDYEIIRWDESNYDITKNKYMMQSYICKKWGFVPDFARLDIIYNEGGIYLDADVEIIRNLDDLLYQKGFVGFETDKFVNFGSGFGAVPGLPVLKELMNYYVDKDFINADGSLNLITSPHFQTDVLSKYGLKKNGEYQVVADMTIFPEKAFCAKSEGLRRIRCTDYSFSIHHYDGSWLDKQARERLLKNENLIDTSGNKETQRVKSCCEETLLSVVVIVFNVENFLEECINSIIYQNYSNIEIILVDDGSKDNSSIICDRFADEYQNIKVIHKKNGGLVDARRAGTEIAIGEYITFVDGDDWIDSDMYSDMMDYAHAYEADVVMSGIYRNFDDHVKCDNNLLVPGFYSRETLEEEVFDKMMFSSKEMNHYVDPSLCNKVFRRNLLLNVLKRTDKKIYYLCEDAAVLYPVMLQSRRVFVAEKQYYHHRITTTPSSHIVCQYKDDKVFERLNIWYSDICRKVDELGYTHIMKNQIDMYYMCKLNQLAYKNVGIDFVQMFSREILRNNEIIPRVKYFKLSNIAMLKNHKVALYGAGKVGSDYKEQLDSAKIEIAVWIDKNAKNIDPTGDVVKSIDSICNMDYDSLVVAIKNENTFLEIKRELTNMGVDEKKIIWQKPIEVFE